MYGNTAYTRLVDTITGIHAIKYYRFYCDFDLRSFIPVRSPVTSFQFDYGETYKYMSLNSGHINIGRPLINKDMIFSMSPQSIMDSSSLNYYDKICNNRSFKQYISKYEKKINKNKSKITYRYTENIPQLPEFLYMKLFNKHHN